MREPVIVGVDSEWSEVFKFEIAVLQESVLSPFQFANIDDVTVLMEEEEKDVLNEMKFIYSVLVYKRVGGLTSSICIWKEAVESNVEINKLMVSVDTVIDGLLMSKVDQRLEVEG